MQRKLDDKVVNAIMNHAIAINERSMDECRDFRIMESFMRKDTLILRWMSIDISDEDRPRQCYYYECFNPDGTPQNCSVNYANQQEANEFFYSLLTLHKQKFCIDHKF